MRRTFETGSPADRSAGLSPSPGGRAGLPNHPLWDEGPAPSFPALHEESTADVCVVGLGGSGLSAILTLLDLGASVVGIDARSVGGGAAGRNGGFLLAGASRFHHDAVRQYGRSRALAIYLRTLAEIDRIAIETPAAVRSTGSLRIADGEEERLDCRLQLEAMRADGLPCEAYRGPEGSGLLFPRDRALQPMRRCRILAARATERGARLFERTRALEIAGDRVRTPSGIIRCGAVVVAVDGRLERLLPELKPRVRTARLQMLATAPDLPVRFPRPVYARWGFEYWQQLPDGRVTLGGFRDRAGEEEWTRSTRPTPAVQGRLERLLRTRLGVRAPVTHRWAASVAFTADGLPVLEQVRPRVWAAGAYSGTGNVIGALCGAAAARLAIGEPSEDASLFGGRPAGG